ncbi:MAG TPA: AAA family ATPase [Micromonospora sp.]|nr:AAA family ATPase [Micromonospora sp.]
MTKEQPLVELIFDRLNDDHDVPSETAEVILAALSSDDDLAAALDGQTTELATQQAAAGPPAHLYLDSVTVAGFRGIGPERKLAIEPGPGLTLVVGRNGSGKSSFAEAIELTLTGDSARWAARTSVWRTGWRNLHAPHPCAITVELRVDGQATPIRVRRSWPDGGDLADAQATVTGGDGADSLERLGLARPLELYRPFLSAAELGKLVNGTPSELFDALYAILGLESLIAADRRLREAIRPLETSIKETRERRGTLHAELDGIDDERAKRAAPVLAEPQPKLDQFDLDQLDAILAEPLDAVADADVDVDVARCRQLAQLPLPQPESVAALAEQLVAACAEVRRYDESRSQASMRTAELLRLSLEHHAEQGDGPCPVCTVGVLDQAWRERGTAALNELRVSTLNAKRATEKRAELAQRVRALIGGIDVPEAAPDGVPLTELQAAVAALRAVPSAPDELAAHLAAHYPAVARAAEVARTGAEEWLRQRDSGWQQAADELRAWLTAVRELPDQQRDLAILKAARKWLSKAGDEIRNARLAPFAEHAQQIWQQLRQESNVDLGGMTLTGSHTRRKVVFPVSVDGADSGTVALGVMSQGEMHALGLATFLPRGCAAESPFRFIVIDDPVQSMDPSKVDGLARVLAELARERQVIVFTHDSRLPEAARRLEIDADVREVLRAEESVVTLRPSLDPVRRYLDDAWAVAKSTEVPEDVRGPVVAELCRCALEAASQRIIWRTQVGRGVPHAEIEAAIGAASRRLTTFFALAFFDDADRGGEVLGRLKNRYGGWAADAYQACRKGVHGAYVGALPALVNDTRRLTEKLT